MEHQPFVPTGRPYVVTLRDDPPNVFGPFETFTEAEEFARGMMQRLHRGTEITVVWSPADGPYLR